MYLQLYIVHNYDIFKKILMEPNFVRMKVPKLKKHLQVQEIGAASKRRKELLDLSVKAHEACLYVEDC